MGSGIELATAYVQVLPSAEGIKGSLSKVLEPEADSAGEKTGKSLGNSIGSFIKTAFVALGVGEFIKDTIMKGADLEQSIGGIETLFGTGGRSLEEYAKSVGQSVEDAREQYQKLEASEKDMLEKAQVAWKTTGLSANDYMQNVTGFSASLLQGLGGDTAKAAEYADRAMVDMSDNANKMGTSMESITNAYQGFAKQNYTMLDNLKLGYGGTKEEMARLIEDASKMTDIQEELGVTIDASSMSFDNIINAISVMQSSLDIAGTTEREAASTISGSMNAIKAAWENLQADMTLGKDLTGDIDAIKDAATAFLDNIAPALQNIITAVPDVFVSLVDAVGPQLIDTGTDMIKGIIEGIGNSLPMLLPKAVEIVVTLVKGLITSIPSLITAALQLVIGLVTGIMEAIPVLVAAIPELINSILMTLMEAIPLIIEAGFTLITSLVSDLPGIITTILGIIPELITSILDTLVTMYMDLQVAGVELFVSLIKALPEIIVKILEAVPKIILSLCQSLDGMIPQMMHAGMDLFVSLIKALPEIIKSIGTAIPQIVTALVTGLTEMLPYMMTAGIQLFTAIIAELPSIISTLVAAVPEIIDALIAALGDTIIEFQDMGPKIVDGLWQGIKGAWDSLTRSVTQLGSSLIKSVKEIFGIHSPSRIFRDEVGKMLDLGLAEGITGNIDEVNKAVATLNDSTMAGIESDIAVNASYAGNMAVSGYVDDRAVYNMLAKLVDAVGKLPGDIGEEIAGEMNGTSISLNNREFGRLVRAVS